MTYMSGYELNDQDIQVVLKRLRAIYPDATEEQAKQLLLKTKMEVREMGWDNPDKLIEYYEQEFGANSSPEDKQ